MANPLEEDAPGTAQGEHGVPGSVRGPLVLLTLLTSAVHLLGLVFRNGHFWGADALGAFGAWLAVPATLALLAVSVFALTHRGGGGAEAPAGDRRVGGSEGIAARWAIPVIPFALAVAGASAFWLLRAGHVFLGDGIVMVTTLPVERAFHPLEPVSMLIEQAAYDALAPWLTKAGLAPHRVAWTSAALVSVAAGALFLPLAWMLARRLARVVEGAQVASNGLGMAGLVFLAIVLQGYLQVFFGYVEVYALAVVSVALYLVAALRFIQDRGPLWQAAAALAIAIGFHLSALALLPSLAVLAWTAVADPERRPGLARDVLLSIAGFLALAVVLAVVGRGYNLGDTVVSLVGTVLARQPEPIPHYFLSSRHVRDFLNGQFLVGPLGMLLFVPAVIATLRAVRHHGAMPAFFLATGTGFIVVCAIAGDSNLGYARNWDLLAPAGFALTVAGLALLLRLLPGRAAARTALIVAVAISCYHTLPWVALNRSFSRSLDRFTTLRLGLGRVESTVGYWYSLQGSNAEAERWLGRALDQYPGNVRAHVFLGDLYGQRGQHDMASTAYRVALELRPEEDEYRLRLVNALVRGGTPNQALPEVERLLRRQPKSPRIWTVYGIVLLGAGRGDEARSAFSQARINAPASLLYRLMVHYADLPGGFERALDDIWPVLIGA